MKLLKLVFFAVFLLTLFAVNNVAAQAIIIKNSELIFYVPHPTRDDAKIDLKSISSKTTITPSGNIVKTATFQLPEGNFLIPEKGTKSIIVAKLTVDGVVLKDERVDIKKSGEFKVTLHLNGSGTSSPNGW